MTKEFKVKTVSDPKEGTSVSTGNPWKRQRLLLEWDEETPTGTVTQRLAATAFNQVVADIQAQGIQAGDRVIASLSMNTRATGTGEYITNDVSIFSIQKL